MNPIEFTTDEANFIINACDQLIRQTGIKNSAMGLAVVGKIQAAAPKPDPENEADKSGD